MTYKILYDFFKQYFANLPGYLYFNVTNLDENSNSLNSNYGAKTTAEYADGSSEAVMYFSIDAVRRYDVGTSDFNLDTIMEVQKISDWCDKMTEARMLPDVVGCVLNEIEIIDSAPNLMIDNEQGLAKYKVFGRVNYLELKGV